MITEPSEQPDGQFGSQPQDLIQQRVAQSGNPYFAYTSFDGGTVWAKSRDLLEMYLKDPTSVDTHVSQSGWLNVTAKGSNGGRTFGSYTAKRSFGGARPFAGNNANGGGSQELAQLDKRVLALTAEVASLVTTVRELKTLLVQFLEGSQVAP